MLGGWAPRKVSCREDIGAQKQDEFGRDGIPGEGTEGKKARGKWSTVWLYAWVLMARGSLAELEPGHRGWGTGDLRSSVCKRQACVRHMEDLHFIPKPEFMEPEDIQGWAPGPMGPPRIALSRILHAHVSGESVHRENHQTKNHRNHQTKNYSF